MEHTSPHAASPDIAPPQCDAEITDTRAWTRTSLAPEDWLIPLPDACLAEIGWNFVSSVDKSSMSTTRRWRTPARPFTMSRTCSDAGT